MLTGLYQMENWFVGNFYQEYCGQAMSMDNGPTPGTLVY